MCSSHTVHSKLSSVQQISNMWAIVVNRFNSSMFVGENKNGIIFGRSICHSSIDYDLIGIIFSRSISHYSINHGLIVSISDHRESVWLGPYTSKVYHTNAVYEYNDYVITEL